MTCKCDNSNRESHDYRVVEVGRNHWMSFFPASWLRRITYSMLPRTVSKKLQKLDTTKVSKDGDFTNSWGNLWQCSVPPQREPPVFQLVFQSLDKAWFHLFCTLPSGTYIH